MAAKVQRFNQTNGLGLLEIRGKGFETMLLCAGEPVAMNWHDCGGSIGQYLRRAATTESLEGELRSLRYVLGGGFDPTFPIDVQCAALLRLFVNGRYNLVYDQAGPNFGVMEFTTATKADDWYYPGPDEVWVATQPASALNPDTVARHRVAIREGKRPLAVIATSNRAVSGYVVGGHHKLRAYIEEQERPWFLAISAVNPPSVDSASAEQLLRGSARAAHYRQWKGSHADD